MFCPKCGSILLPKKGGASCSCGYKSSEAASGKFTESAKKEQSRMDVVDSEHDLRTMPKMKVECPKCRNQEAGYWEVQTRAADEPATKFLKCTKCKHIWRDYN